MLGTFKVLVCYIVNIQIQCLFLQLLCYNLLLSLYQQTPLHVAASKGRDYTVECLVQKEADMDIKDKTGVYETTLLMVV